MDHIYCVNFEEFNSGAEEQACVCCLDSSTKLAKLSTCKHTGIIDILVDIKVEYEELYVCYICHNTLDKFHRFRKQVQDSLYILQRKEKSLDNKQNRYGISAIEQLNYNARKKDAFERVTVTGSFRQPIQNKLIANSDLSDEKLNDDIDLDSHYVEEALVPQIEVDIKKEESSAESGQKIFETPATSSLHSHSQSLKELRSETLNDRAEVPQVRVLQILLTEEEMTRERDERRRRQNFALAKFKCDSCIRVFHHQTYLDEHNKQKHEPTLGSFLCEWCKFLCKTKEQLNQHLKFHFIRYECLDCKKRYTKNILAVRHFNETHAPDKEVYWCNKCDYTTDHFRTLKHHRESHNPITYKCEKCGKQHRSEGAYRRHMLIIHSVQAYPCPKCDKKFKYFSGLTTHTARMHSDTSTVEPYYCTECNVQLSSKYAFKAHFKTRAHHKKGELEYICHDCGKSFLEKKLLESHITFVHLRKSDHVCHICKSISKTATSLKHHIKTVHYKWKQPKTHMCQYCGKGFQSNTILKTHIRTHTGERPLQCARCPATFAHPAARFTHNRLVHHVQRKKDQAKT